MQIQHNKISQYSTKDKYMVKEVATQVNVLCNYRVSEVFHIRLCADSIVIEDCNIACVSLSPFRSVWQYASLTLTPNACRLHCLWELFYTLILTL